MVVMGVNSFCATFGPQCYEIHEFGDASPKQVSTFNQIWSKHDAKNLTPTTCQNELEWLVGYA